MSHVYLSALSWLPQDLLHFTSRAIEVHLEWRERAGNTLHSGKAHYSSFHSRPRSGQKNPKQFYNTLFSHSPSLSRVTWIFQTLNVRWFVKVLFIFRRWDMLKRCWRDMLLVFGILEMMVKSSTQKDNGEMNIYHEKDSLYTARYLKTATKQKIKFGKLDCRAGADAHTQKKFDWRCVSAYLIRNWTSDCMFFFFI